MSTQLRGAALGNAKQRGVKRCRIGALSVAKLMKLLEQGWLNQTELAEESGLSRNTVRSYVTALCREKMAYIVSWELDPVGRYNIPIHKLGEGRDMPKPRPLIRTKAGREEADRRRAEARKRRDQRDLQRTITGGGSAQARTP